MAIYLEDLALARKEVTVEFSGGRSLKVTYDPNLLTADVISVSGESTTDLCGVLATLITDWDLVDGDGAKAPITEDFLASKIRLPILNAILETIVEDAFPKKATPSTGGSRRRGQ